MTSPEDNKPAAQAAIPPARSGRGTGPLEPRVARPRPRAPTARSTASGPGQARHAQRQGRRSRRAVALRLKAGDPQTIQVDVGDNGSADFSFARSDVYAIKVKGGDGNDSVRIDDANGAFTDSIPTTIAGGDGNDTLQGGQTQIAAENETFMGGEATTSSTAARATTPPTSATAMTRSAGTTARAPT